MVEKEKKELLLKRIEGTTASIVENMSFEAMAMLTDGFEEELVRLLLLRGGTSLYDQRKIFFHIKDNYKKWKNDTDILWSVQLPWNEVYPDYMNDLQLDIECGMIITPEGSVHVKESKPFKAPPVLGLAPRNRQNAPADERQRAHIAQLEAQLKEQEEKTKVQEARVQQLEAQLNEVQANGGQKWIDCFDSFLNPSLNAEAIAQKLQAIDSPHLPKNERGFWWAVLIVLGEIHWIPSPKNCHKTILQWANLHFDCGWDWRKEHLFKFADISQKIKITPSAQWNANTTGTAIGEYYGSLAKKLRETFVEDIKGMTIDRAEFIRNGCRRINEVRRG